MNNYKINPDNFEWLEIEDREDCNEIQVLTQMSDKNSRKGAQMLQAYMKQLTGASSVPRVFIGGSCIGGGDETSGAHRQVLTNSTQKED